MSYESDADRLAALNGWDTAVYGGVTIQGIFDDGFLAVQEGNLAVEEAKPVFSCREIDVANIAHNSSITVNGVAYTVAEIKPDGQGMVDLGLYKA